MREIFGVYDSRDKNMQTYCLRHLPLNAPNKTVSFVTKGIKCPDCSTEKQEIENPFVFKRIFGGGLDRLTDEL